MKLTFLGANHEVTGSCTLLEAAGQRYLIDCGMEQGKDIYENQPIPVAPGEIDGVLATHAHIDHTGLLPLLVRNGFRGKIYFRIWLANIRFEAAKTMMRQFPQYSNDLISAECGFSARTYLYRIFKEKTGKTPTEWRTGGCCNISHIK